MKKVNVAILGATGAVGRQMLQVLEERDFPVEAALPLFSVSSTGSFVTLSSYTFTPTLIIS